MDIYKHKEVVYDTDDSKMIVDEYEFNYTENEWNAFMEQHKEPGTRIKCLKSPPHANLLQGSSWIMDSRCIWRILV